MEPETDNDEEIDDLPVEAALDRGIKRKRNSIEPEARNRSRSTTTPLLSVQDAHLKLNTLHPSKTPFKSTPATHLDRYTRDYSLHINYLSQYRAGAVTEGAFSSTQPFGPDLLADVEEDRAVYPSGTVWTGEEKQAFFGSLARRSRLRPDLISRDIKTKSEAEVGWYLDALDYMSQLRLARFPSNTRTRDWQEGYAPIALEVSDAWIEQEEEFSQALTLSEEQKRKSRLAAEREASLQARIKPLKSLKSYTDIKGKSSFKVKNKMRAEEFQERIVEAESIIREQLVLDADDFLGDMDRKRVLLVGLLLRKRFQEGNEEIIPLDLDEDGLISMEAYESLRSRWKEEERRFEALESIRKGGWTEEERGEYVFLKRKVGDIRAELEDFEKNLVETLEDEKEDGQEEEEEPNEDPDIPHKPKRRQKKKRKFNGRYPPIFGRPVAPPPKPVEPTEWKWTNRTIAATFPLRRAKPLVDKLKNDVEIIVAAEKESRRLDLRKIEKKGPKENVEDWRDVVNVVAERADEMGLGMFNLARVRRMVRPQETPSESPTRQISARLLEVLHAHLNLFLHELMNRLVFLGEGYSSARPAIPEEIRNEISPGLVYNAMEQLGLGHMIPPKKLRSKYVEPTPVRHLLPTYPNEKGGLDWADEIFPDVTWGVIDADYGRAIAGSENGEEEDLLPVETDDEDLKRDEREEEMELLQDRLDAFKDQAFETALVERYSDSEEGRLGVFCDRFDWRKYESKKLYISKLRINWEVDEGTTDSLRKAWGTNRQKGSDEEMEIEEEKPVLPVESDQEGLRKQYDSLRDKHRRLLYIKTRKLNDPDYHPALHSSISSRAKVRRRVVTKEEGGKKIKSLEHVDVGSSEDEEDEGEASSDEDSEDNVEEEDEGNADDEEDEGEEDDDVEMKEGDAEEESETGDQEDEQDDRQTEETSASTGSERNTPETTLEVRASSRSEESTQPTQQESRRPAFEDSDPDRTDSE